MARALVLGLPRDKPTLSQSQVPGWAGIVIAESWAALRRAPWNLDTGTAQAALSPWSDQRYIVATPVPAYAEILRSGRSLNLGGNVHDLLIALTCRDHGLPLVTLDRRRCTLAAELAGLDTTLLLPTNFRSAGIAEHPTSATARIGPVARVRQQRRARRSRDGWTGPGASLR